MQEIKDSLILLSELEREYGMKLSVYLPYYSIEDETW